MGSSLNLLENKASPPEVDLFGNRFNPFGSKNGSLALISDIIKYANSIQVA
jgi:hypothetical protein